MKQEYDKNKQKSNKILLQTINKPRLQQENVLKIGVEHTKNNGEFCFLFIPLGNLAQGSLSRSFQSTCDPCSPMGELCMN